MLPSPSGLAELAGITVACAWELLLLDGLAARELPETIVKLVFLLPPEAPYRCAAGGVGAFIDLSVAGKVSGIGISIDGIAPGLQPAALSLTAMATDTEERLLRVRRWSRQEL